KLDIANAASGQLDIESGLASASALAEFLADTLASNRHGLHSREVERGGIRERLDGLEQLAPRLAIARRGTCLDHHLEFPIAGAGLIILPGAFEREGDFTEAAIRA